MTRKNYITIGASVLGVVTAYAIGNRIYKQSLLKKLDDILAKGSGATGTGLDMEKMPAFSTSYWKRYPNSVMPQSEIDRLAKKLYEADSGPFWPDDEQAAYSVFHSLDSWVHVSQLADTFNKKYGIDLFTFLDEGDSVEGFLDVDELTKVKNIVDQMKTK